MAELYLSQSPLSWTVLFRKIGILNLSFELNASRYLASLPSLASLFSIAMLNLERSICLTQVKAGCDCLSVKHRQQCLWATRCIVVQHEEKADIGSDA